jgi:hypothetical protein
VERDLAAAESELETAWTCHTSVTQQISELKEQDCPGGAKDKTWCIKCNNGQKRCDKVERDLAAAENELETAWTCHTSVTQQISELKSKTAQEVQKMDP